MRALVAERFGEPARVLREADVPDPRPGDGSVCVRPEFVGLNFLDVSLCRGQYPAQPQPPLVPGVECVGVLVSDAGPGLPAGARVVACPTLPAGALAEQVAVPSALLVRLPDDVPSALAAGVPVTYQTAWFALDRARLAPGETVLVHAAAGGVGTATIQLAKGRGATVIAVAGGEQKARLCAELGADVVVDHRRERFADVVAEATDGRGVDVVVDPVGGDVFAGSLQCLAFEGRILPIGAAQAPPAPVDPMELTARNIDMIGLSWGSAYPFQRPDAVAEVYRQLFAGITAGTLRPVVDREIALADAPQALQDLADGRTHGKLVVRVAPPDSSG